jgi:hypothetical protein
MMSREAVFECTYASAEVVKVAHVRAWDVREAMDLFADELRSDGVADGGEIRARPRSGGKAGTARYRGH